MLDPARQLKAITSGDISNADNPIKGLAYVAHRQVEKSNCFVSLVAYGLVLDAIRRHKAFDTPALKAFKLRVNEEWYRMRSG